MNCRILYILLLVANANAFCAAFHQGIDRRQTSALYKFRQSVDATKSQWSSAISTNPDFKAAVAEALALASSSHHDPSKVNLVLTYVSSIYEATASFDTLDADIRKAVPPDAAIIGCTTGGVIGQLSLAEDSLPVECEARASVGITLASFQDCVGLETFILDKEGAKQYIENSDMILSTDGKDKKSSLSLIFGTESVKAMLPAISSALSTRENCNSFGVLASGVSAAYTPKIFLSKSAKDGPMQRLFLGLVGVKFTGPISIKTVAARSCLPVGPRYRVLRRNGNEILLLKSEDPTDVVSSPLEKLDSVLHMISADNADLLKRDLLLGIVPATEQDMLKSEYFFGQKPTAFDPLTGSITVHSLPDKDIDIVFQFCVKDSSNALLDAQRAQLKIRGLVESAKKQKSNPFALFMIGCNDRGNKIFRYQSWEAIQLHHQMSEAGFRTTLSPNGFYGDGAFSRLTSSKQGGEQIPALMETDSIYILLTDSPVVVEDKELDNSILKLYESPSLDIMSAWEKKYFDDENDGIITSKKDSDSSSGVRVAGMDYFVPEKAPLPRNVLESLVWGRESDVERLKERFALPRAMTMAKLADSKFTKNSLVNAIKAASLSTKFCLPVIASAVSASLYYGKSSLASLIEGQLTMSIFAKEAAEIGVAGLAANVESGVYMGSYEALTDLKSSTTLPVICDDIVIYGYQIFRAKAAGADAIKLMASVLTTQEIRYNAKVAKALGVTVIVVVSSKQQLLDVLSEVPEIEIISVSNRNMKLWKIDRGKSHRILTNPDIIAAIKLKRLKMVEESKSFILLEEGFTTREEVLQAKNDGVDALYFGEELLMERHKSLEAAIRQYM